MKFAFTGILVTTHLAHQLLQNGSQLYNLSPLCKFYITTKLNLEYSFQ